MDWTNIPAIDCGRVKLRVIDAGDESAIYDIYSDPNVIRYWGEPAMKSGDEKTLRRLSPARHSETYLYSMGDHS